MPPSARGYRNASSSAGTLLSCFRPGAVYERYLEKGATTRAGRWMAGLGERVSGAVLLTAVPGGVAYATVALAHGNTAGCYLGAAAIAVGAAVRAYAYRLTPRRDDVAPHALRAHP